jgi:hypothetical protein
VRNGDGYELHIPVEKLAIGDDEEVDTEAEPEPEAEDDDAEVIEVDLGRTHGWALAEVVRTRGDWLHYRLQEPYRDKTDKHGGKVQIYARDILWRPAATAM